MEVAIANTLELGEIIVAANPGMWGQRMCDLANIHETMKAGACMARGAQGMQAAVANTLEPGETVVQGYVSTFGMLGTAGVFHRAPPQPACIN